MNRDFFETWFKKHLLPKIPKDNIVILDNISFHRKKRLFDITANYNRTITFLLPYSPKLNPVEHS